VDFDENGKVLTISPAFSHSVECTNAFEDLYKSTKRPTEIHKAMVKMSILTFYIQFYRVFQNYKLFFTKL
jgi:hypothetical protein